MIRRIGIYLNEMFPVPSFLGSILTAVAIQLTYLRLFDLRAEFHAALLLPALVLTAVSLLIRVMDEFKDYQDDLTNFPNRPLPSGRVLPKDLIVLGWSCVGLVLILSLSSSRLFIWACLTICFTGLMLKWFFIEERMRKSLPLAVATHHPIVLFNFVYLLLACVETNSTVTFEKAIYILPLCLIFTNWEVVRKVRAPEQETSYTTYSKIFGPRAAISIALAIQLTFNLTMFNIFAYLGSPMHLRVIYGLVQFYFSYPSLYFLFTLKLEKPLKPIAESQILVVVMSLLTAALL